MKAGHFAGGALTLRHTHAFLQEVEHWHGAFDAGILSTRLKATPRGWKGVHKRRPPRSPRTRSCGGSSSSPASPMLLLHISGLNE